MAINRGDRFGRWTAILDTGERTKDRHHIWICKCDCGSVRKVDSASLVQGKSKSCGCWRRERTSRDNSSPNIIKSRTETGRRLWEDRKKIIGIADGTNLLKCLSQRPRADSSTGVRGIMRERKGGYYAQVCFKGKRYCSYGHKTIESAKKARENLWDEYVRPYVQERKEKA